MGICFKNPQISYHINMSRKVFNFVNNNVNCVLIFMSLSYKETFVLKVDKNCFIHL